MRARRDEQPVAEFVAFGQPYDDPDVHPHVLGHALGHAVTSSDLEAPALVQPGEVGEPVAYRVSHTSRLPQPHRRGRAIQR